MIFDALMPRSERDFSLLLIDDDLDLCTSVSTFLAQHGLRLDVEHDGRRGIARLLDGQYDLAMLDVTLPALDGFEVLRHVRRRSAVPVIVLSAGTERADRVAGLEAGADDYLPKPFGPDELLARIRAVLRRARPERTTVSNDILIINGVTLDPGSRDLWLDGSRVDLTSTEYDILEHLMRAAGRVVSRDELMLAVCRREASPFDRSLDVHISHLRRKLEGQRALIRTVRGVGYLFCREADAVPRAHPQHVVRAPELMPSRG
jgi:DNA-binding response OmpR family regulator